MRPPVIVANLPIDEVLLIWDQNLVQPFNNALFPDEEVLMDEAYGNFERDPIKAGQLHDQLMSLPKDERERLLEEHLLSSLKEPLRLGICEFAQCSATTADDLCRLRLLS